MKLDKSDIQQPTSPTAIYLHSDLRRVFSDESRLYLLKRKKISLEEIKLDQKLKIAPVFKLITPDEIGNTKTPNIINVPDNKENIKGTVSEYLSDIDERINLKTDIEVIKRYINTKFIIDSPFKENEAKSKAIVPRNRKNIIFTSLTIHFCFENILDKFENFTIHIHLPNNRDKNYVDFFKFYIIILLNYVYNNIIDIEVPWLTYHKTVTVSSKFMNKTEIQFDSSPQHFRTTKRSVDCCKDNKKNTKKKSQKLLLCIHECQISVDLNFKILSITQRGKKCNLEITITKEKNKRCKE